MSLRPPIFFFQRQSIFPGNFVFNLCCVRINFFGLFDQIS